MSKSQGHLCFHVLRVWSPTAAPSGSVQLCCPRMTIVSTILSVAADGDRSSSPTLKIRASSYTTRVTTEQIRNRGSFPLFWISGLAQPHLRRWDWLLCAAHRVMWGLISQGLQLVGGRGSSPTLRSQCLPPALGIDEQGDRISPSHSCSHMAGEYLGQFSFTQNVSHIPLTMKLALLCCPGPVLLRI